jgi:hypothetical protein
MVDDGRMLQARPVLYPYVQPKPDAAARQVVTSLEAVDSNGLLHFPSADPHGWWGMSERAEAFLDELVTWRELGFNLCSKREDFDPYESLPEWARARLEDLRQGPLHELGEHRAEAEGGPDHPALCRRNGNTSTSTPGE